MNTRTSEVGSAELWIGRLRRRAEEPVAWHGPMFRTLGWVVNREICSRILTDSWCHLLVSNTTEQ